MTWRPINIIEILDREKKYRNAVRYWNSYLNWKQNRNPKRAILEEKYKFDVKHGMHLWRLLQQGKELLETGHITLPRPEKDQLLDIKNGKWSYEKLIEETENLNKIFDDLYQKSPLPKTPNHEKIEELCIEICEEFLKR